MARRVGSDPTVNSTAANGVIDAFGNAIISSDSSFGGSPLGTAALNQVLFNIPNGTFDLLPPDITQNIDDDSNPLPYWSIEESNTDQVTAKIVYDSSTKTYSLRLTPNSSTSGSEFTISTRSSVVSDDNLSLRQRLVSTISKVGTYSGATQFNISFTCSYYDHTDTLLSSYTTATIYDNATLSSVVGFTTSGTSVIPTAASYVIIRIKLTATATVTSGISVDIDTLLLQNSLGGGGSFLIVERYDASTTWTRPTGVDYLQTLIAVGAGGGGGGGGAFAQSDNSSATRQATGGGGGGFVYLTDVYIGDNATYAIGIGAGGSGGAGATATKAAGAATAIAATGTAGANGGSTTFGSKATATGGSGGAAGAGITNSTPINTDRATAGTGSPKVWDRQTFTSGGGGNCNGTINVNFQTFDGQAGSMESGSYTAIPLVTSYPSAGSSGTAGGGGTMTGNTGSAAAAGGAAGYFCGGGGIGAGYASNTSTDRQPTNASEGRSGGGGGGGATYRTTSFNTAGTYTVTAGNGGAASALSGSGGGGGGGIWLNTVGNTPAITLTAGSGGNAGGGFIILSYIA